MSLLWKATNNGITIGQIGSENGVIIADEEYNGLSRITLEENGVVAPYSITCGVYGLMAHTAFTEDKVKASQMYQGMKQELQAFLDSDNIDSNDWCEIFTRQW